MRRSVVVLGRPGETAFGRAERVARPVVVAQRGDGLSRRASDGFGVRGRPQLGLEVRILADARLCAVDLLDLVAQELDAPRELMGIGEQLGRRGDRGTPRPVQLADLGNGGRVGAVSVEQRELPRRLEQSLLVVLPVDLAEVDAQPGQPSDRHRPVVHARHRPPVGPDLSSDDHASLAGSHDLDHRVVLGQLRRVEDGLDPCGIGPGADLVGCGTCSQRQRDRVDDERFARAGLAGEHGEAVAERQAHRFHHRQVLDRQLTQGHQYGSRLALVRSRS